MADIDPLDVTLAEATASSETTGRPEERPAWTAGHGPTDKPEYVPIDFEGLPEDFRERSRVVINLEEGSSLDAKYLQHFKDEYAQYLLSGPSGVSRLSPTEAETMANEEGDKLLFRAEALGSITSDESNQIKADTEKITAWRAEMLGVLEKQYPYKEPAGLKALLRTGFAVPVNIDDPSTRMPNVQPSLVEQMKRRVRRSEARISRRAGWQSEPEYVPESFTGLYDVGGDTGDTGEAE